MSSLNDIKCFLLDLDGTLYLSDTPIDGAKEAVSRMQARAKVIFVTNNSSTSRGAYYTKLNRMGFTLMPEDIYSSTSATIDYLLDNHGGKSVYLLATKEVTAEFLSAGINLVQENADIALLTFDKTITYKKIEKLCRFLSKGAFFIATHPDKVCPTLDGSIPDVGSFLSLIHCACGREPDVICGKPSKTFGERILKKTGLKPSQIAMVGDRLSTDFKFAKNCGFVSMVVLSGEAKQEDILPLKAPPDFVFSSISEWDK